MIQYVLKSCIHVLGEEQQQLLACIKRHIHCKLCVDVDIFDKQIACIIVHPREILGGRVSAVMMAASTACFNLELVFFHGHEFDIVDLLRLRTHVQIQIVAAFVHTILDKEVIGDGNPVLAQHVIFELVIMPLVLLFVVFVFFDLSQRRQFFHALVDFVAISDSISVDGHLTVFGVANACDLGVLHQFRFILSDLHNEQQSFDAQFAEAVPHKHGEAILVSQDLLHCQCIVGVVGGRLQRGGSLLSNQLHVKVAILVLLQYPTSLNPARNECKQNIACFCGQ
mmetsp:Transcript_30981/g.49750  ORF Transcript_30981/g.49750 Transcript_30981/m.49750 type:complete len:282 (-) Transcript_30981:227-1072(-)